MPKNTDVWITGIGAMSPLGSDFSEIAASLFSGKSAIRTIENFDVEHHPCRIAGQVELPGSPAGICPDTYDALSPLDRCTVYCCTQALKDAGLFDGRSRLRIGLALGFAAEWMTHWDTDSRLGGDLVHRSSTGRQSTVDTVKEALDLSGPVLSIAAACASGNHALAMARQWVQLGWVDVCLAGACDIGVTPHSLASFGNLRALSRRNETPEGAVRPFDCDRDGMVLGEGGAVFLIESAQRARARRAHAYGEISAVGMTSDAHHLVIPSNDPTQAIAAIQQGLELAQVNAAEVDYVNAHATGTPVGDACESKILQAVFGSSCAKVPVSSTKSMTGHLLSAAASMEALACLAAIVFDTIPPTINLEHPDPECNLCHVANTAREYPVRTAISNSFGFGGHNTSLVLKAIR